LSLPILSNNITLVEKGFGPGTPPDGLSVCQLAKPSYLIALVPQPLLNPSIPSQIFSMPSGRMDASGLTTNTCTGNPRSFSSSPVSSLLLPSRSASVKLSRRQTPV